MMIKMVRMTMIKMMMNDDDDKVEDDDDQDNDPRKETRNRTSLSLLNFLMRVTDT